MKQDATNVNWEEVFIQEALELEEKMTSLNFDDLTRSRIRISLEKNILSWEKYQAWFTQNFNCAALTSAIPQTELLKLRDQATLNREVFSQYDFWSEDLIPIEVWDSHLIVLGLEQNSKLLQIPNCIFILADPFTLSFIANAISEEENAADFSSFSQPPPRGSINQLHLILKHQNTLNMLEV